VTAIVPIGALQGLTSALGASAAGPSAAGASALSGSGSSAAFGLAEPTGSASAPLAGAEQLSGLGAVNAPAGVGAGEAGAGTGGQEPGGFGEALTGAISSLEQSQQSASSAAQALATGTTGNPESAVMTVADAQLAMQLASQIRTKATEATQQIFQTQV
jgi:flagellar hook-basal body complex protein FliE